VLAGLGGAVALTAAARPAAATVPRDPRVERLLARMSVAEKVGQLNLVTGADNARTALAGGALGGALNVIGVPAINALQEIAVKQSPLGIPLIFGLDVIHGYTTNFPIPLAQASSFDPEVTRTEATVAAAEARASGICWAYGPMLDLARDPRWGRIAEGNGEDPYLGAKLAEAKVRGFQGDDYSADDKVAACAKHYVGYGLSEGGRDYNTADLSIEKMHNYYLPAFRAAVRAGVATVMPSFSSINGVPAHADSYTLRDVLKGLYGFDGVVVSDWGGIDQMIAWNYAADGADAARLGLSAGVDMDMVSGDFARNLAQLLASGAVSRTHLDDAVRRVLRLKYRLGLFDRPYADPAREVTAPTAATRAAARTVAGRSMVLLKNSGVLPLSTSVGAIAVVGPLGQATGDLIGCWGGAGVGSSTPPTTIVDAIRAAAPNANVTYTAGCAINSADTSGIGAAAAAASAADAVVVVVGESAVMSGENRSRSNIKLPGVQEQLVSAIAGSGKPFAVVLINGRPLDLSAVDAVAPAILEAWAPGLEGGNAIADVLFGVVNPGGKLPVTFPRSVGQIPYYYNHDNTGHPGSSQSYLDLPAGPQWAFGHGMSYTTFAIGNLTLSADHLRRSNGSVRVGVTVTNTGKRAGDEVVQLYLRDPVASIIQPIRKLRGFRRVTLDPGGSTTVEFTLTCDDVGFYDNDGRFVVENGTMEVYVGNSSDNTPLHATFTVG